MGWSGGVLGRPVSEPARVFSRRCEDAGANPHPTSESIYYRARYDNNGFDVHLTPPKLVFSSATRNLLNSDSPAREDARASPPDLLGRFPIEQTAAEYRSRLDA